MKLADFLLPFNHCFGSRAQHTEAEQTPIELTERQPRNENTQQAPTVKRRFPPNVLQLNFLGRNKRDAVPAQNLPSLNDASAMASASASATASSAAAATSSLDRITDQGSAKAAIEEFKKTLLEQGKNYRINDQEREEFITAFKQLFGSAGETIYQLESSNIESIREMDMIDFKEHPELAHIKTPDLVAIRAWTGEGVWPLVQDALEGGLFDQEKNWHDPGLKVNPGVADLKDWEKVRLVLPYVKTFISALHSLPSEYNHIGLVHTGETQNENWVNARYQQGKDMTDWRFFATAMTAAGAWQNQNVNWVTNAVEGKRIHLFSHNPQEGEVMIVPPATHHAREIKRRENELRPDHPFFDIALVQKKTS